MSASGTARLGNSTEAFRYLRRLLTVIYCRDRRCFDGVRCRGARNQTVGCKWLETYPALAGLRQSTIEGYKGVLRRHVYPRFGEKVFTEVRREDIRMLVAELVARGKNRGLIKHVVAPIRGVFNEAIEAGLQLPNPAARIGRFLRDRSDPAHRIDPLTAEEEARLLGTARHAYPRHFSLLLFALRTGMRLGEILGLQWGDIDRKSVV